MKTNKKALVTFLCLFLVPFMLYFIPLNGLSEQISIEWLKTNLQFYYNAIIFLICMICLHFNVNNIEDISSKIRFTGLFNCRIGLIIAIIIPIPSIMLNISSSLIFDTILFNYLYFSIFVNNDNDFKII